MNRKIKRALKKNEKELTSIAQRILIRNLKALDIDFIRSGDKILSNRNRDVERLYDQCMMEVIVDFQRLDGSLHKLKQFYGYK